MKKNILSFILTTLSFALISQNVLYINDKEVTLDEFKTIFYKNNSDEKITSEYLDEYIQLYINFKLKVLEAERLNMDTLSSFLNELEGYREQLAEPYLKNKDFDENMILQAYERMLSDVSASHILIPIPDDLSKKEVDLAYEKALSIRSSIIEKAITFEEAALEFSSDTYSSKNGGYLGFFTAFMMVYDFETAVYNNPKGEITLPVRTKYGFHLIRTDDIRPAIGTVQVSHIMFRTTEGSSQSQLNIAKDKIYDISKKLTDGEDFVDLAERFSEDRSTAVKGGVLPPFGVGKMVPEFEKVAFSLSEIGQVSKPFRTNYGWHIIKLIDKKPIGEFEEIRDEIKNKIKRDSRGELSKEALFKKLRKEYSIYHNVKAFSELRKSAFYQVLKGKWDGKNNINSVNLFTIDKSEVKVKTFVDYILSTQSLNSDFDILYQQFLNDQLLAYEKLNLEKKYPDYKALVKEYKEGILLFDLTNKMVWKKAVEDSSGLEDFYNLNINDYQWPDRVDAKIYTSLNLSTAKKVRSYLNRKQFNSNVDEDKLLNKANLTSPLSLQITSSLFSKGDNKYVDNIEWVKGISSDIRLEDGSIIIIEINDFIPSGPKLLNDNRGKVISDYQNYLDKKWINTLRDKYIVKINKEVLYSLIN